MKRLHVAVLVLVGACQSTPAVKKEPVASEKPATVKAPTAPPGVTREATALAQRARAGGQDAASLYWQGVAAWHVENNPAKAEALADRALAADPHHLRSLLLRCTLANAQRRYAAFLERCARVVDEAPVSAEAEVALAYLDHGRGQHPDHPPRLAMAAQAASDGCAKTSPPGCAQVATHALRSAMMVASARGDTGAWRGLAGRAGLLTHWTVAGPYGPPDVDTFRRQAGLAAQGVPPSVPAPLVQGGVFSSAQRLITDGLVMPARYGVGGFYAAHSWVHVARPARVMVEFRPSSAARLYVDGVSVAAADPWVQPLAARIPAFVTIVPGWHRFSVEQLADPGDRFEVTVVGDNGSTPVDAQQAQLSADAAQAPAVTFVPQPPTAESQLAALVERDPSDVEGALSLVTLWSVRGQAEKARALAMRVVDRFPLSGRAHQLAATMIEDDDALPASVRTAGAHQQCQRALALDPSTLICRYRLAVLEQQAHPDGGMESLLAVARDRPDYPHVWRSLFEAYRTRGWNVEAASAADKAMALGGVDGVAEPAASFHAGLGDHVRARSLREHAPNTQQTPYSSRAAQLLADRLEDAAALKEWDRLLTAFPDHPDQADRLPILKRGGDLRVLRDALEKHLQRFPSDGDAQLQLCTTLRALGDARAARACVTRLQASFPAMAAADRVAADLAGNELGDDATLPVADARALLKELDAQVAAGEAYLKDSPTVVVLDLGRRILKTDGGNILVKHRIIRVGTKEAADQMGELAFGGNEERRAVRVFKADGRVLEPEVAQGKTEVSLSGLGPGDAFEVRTVTSGDNAPPDGIFSDTFYLADRFPVMRAEYILDVPQALMPLLRLSMRGVPAPVVTSTDGVVRHAWRAQSVPPFQPEPFAVTPVEYVPHVQVLLRGDEGQDARAACRIGAAMGRSSPEMVELAARLKARGKRPSEWLALVLDEVRGRVEPEQRPMEASHALAQKRGSHLALVKTLLRLMDVRARMVVVATDLAPIQDLPLPRRRDVPLLVLPTENGDVLFTSVGPHLLEGPLPPMVTRGTAMEADCDEMERLGQAYTIPAAGEHDWENGAVVEVVVTPAGAVKGTLAASLVGPLAMGLRKDVGRATQEQLTQWMGATLQPLVPGVNVTSFDTSDLNARKGPLDLKVGFEAADVVRNGNGTMLWDRLLEKPVLASLVGGAAPQDYLRVAQRVSPLMLSRPFRERTVMRVTLPAGVEVTQAPRASDVEGTGFRVTQQVSVVGNVVTITRTTRVDVARIPPADYPAWRARVERMLADGRNRLEWKAAGKGTTNKPLARASTP